MSCTSHISGDFNDARNHQYVLANAYIYQTCDELVSVYDANSDNDEGGNEQVIKLREGNIPSEYQFPHDFCVRPNPLPARIIHRKES
ncbi:MAG: hypothetical protein ACI831_001875 [Candidatus Azotimanducaceae bacterium]|jgi:hypothetical protein